MCSQCAGDYEDPEYRAYEDADGGDFIDDDGDDLEDDEEQFDCGMTYDARGRLQGCSMVGSEECDFECPYREGMERSLRASYAARIRHSKKKAKK